MTTDLERPSLHWLPALWISLAGLLLAACGARQEVQALAAAQTPLPSVDGPAVTLVTPTAAITATPNAAPRPTHTSTVTPTATPTLHPMMIEAMRRLEYPGSDIVYEETLAVGANYYRYLTSYRSEGLKIYALLTIPFGDPPETGWPVIVFNHGFIPPDVYRTTERYVAYVDWLARSGYIVFRPDYRGNGFSEGEANGAYSTPDYTIDVLNAVASVQRLPEADPDRVGMWGHSMGGYITLRSMVINPKIRAGVIWAGVVASYPDLLARWRRTPNAPTPTPDGTPRGWRSAFVAEFGSPEENPEFWNAISSNSYLADLSGPVQLHHGTADTSVPLIFSQLLTEQIKAVGGVVEYYEYAGNDHDITRSFGTAMTRTIEFFNKYVKEAR